MLFLFSSFLGFLKNKSNRMAQGLCFLFLWCIQKKTIEGHKGCVFVFWGAPKKNKCTRRAQGLCFFVFGASRKNYRRAQGLCFSFFDASKKQVQ